jgi:hypothetical protein
VVEDSAGVVAGDIAEGVAGFEVNLGFVLARLVGIVFDRVAEVDVREDHILLALAVHPDHELKSNHLE